jgi:hypothetical protein
MTGQVYIIFQLRRVKVDSIASSSTSRSTAVEKWTKTQTPLGMQTRLDAGFFKKRMLCSWVPEKSRASVIVAIFARVW